MDEALIKIGLPVTCSSCGDKAFVKPNTDYNGWYCRRLGSRRRWYCPKDSVHLKRMIESMNEAHVAPPARPEETIEDLYRLLD